MGTASDGEQYRFLHVDPTRPPTSNPYLAAQHEPEMVSAECEAKLVARAHRRELERRHAQWVVARETLRAGVTQAQHALGRPFASEVRVLQRQVDRIDRRVGGRSLM